MIYNTYKVYVISHVNWKKQLQENKYRWLRFLLTCQVSNDVKMNYICSNWSYVLTGPYYPLWDTRYYSNQQLLQMNVMPFVHWKIRKESLIKATKCNMLLEHKISYCYSWTSIGGRLLVRKDKLKYLKCETTGYTKVVLEHEPRNKFIHLGAAGMMGIMSE